MYNIRRSRSKEDFPGRPLEPPRYRPPQRAEHGGAMESATGTTESTLIGAFACVLVASLLRQVCVPGLSFAWSRQASVIAAVPLAGGSALLLAWRHGIATTTTLSGAMVLGASLLLAVSFTSTVGANESGDSESGLPDVASVEKLIKARRSIFPADYSGEAVSREALLRAMGAANWAPTHGKTEPWRFVVLQGAAAFSTLQDAKRRATVRLMADTPEQLAKELTKMERKAKQMDKVGALIAICVKRVETVKGKLRCMGRDCRPYNPSPNPNPNPNQASSCPSGRRRPRWHVPCRTCTSLSPPRVWRAIGAAAV